MTIVNTTTGELVESIGADEARRLTTEAQNELRSSREHFDRAWSLIEQAVEGAGHLDLGYRSPGDYLHQEFDGVLSGLDVSARRIAVRTMTDWGLSTRAIAKPLGVSNKTVSIDQRSPVTEVTPQTPAPQEGEASARDQDAAHDDSAASASTDLSPVAAGQPEQGASSNPPPAPCARPLATVTGIDGKNYTRPTPATKPAVQPVPSDDDYTDQDRAEELAASLAGHLSALYAVTVPERRADYLANWSLGTAHRPVLGQKYVSPRYMREIADALRTFATEWENAR